MHKEQAGGRGDCNMKSLLRWEHVQQIGPAGGDLSVISGYCAPRRPPSPNLLPASFSPGLSRSASGSLCYNIGYTRTKISVAARQSRSVS